ncbi:hypothetical protein D1816_04530 [Aquimarina sp. AD10]|uniref:hypothetical protein n=1 Tax=Aquimarina sp. AD10 TaxID=1714849 RepID=UPI000E4B2B8E|nr:hypothetical protein [Aquimarina sp. AD10]AXT59651.1 hypothetical protein D1816_04530 [Aquimarina sp. AD10]RKM97527.1 hypothetical protein D7033_14110 [Aquimarina sp. AD10]
MKTIKKSNICKNINSYQIDKTIVKTHKPGVGDVAIFEVVSIGSLNAIQDFEGRNSHIFEGDKVMLSFGNRYASNQFEGYIPETYLEEYDLIGKGGVVGKVVSMHYKLELKGPTKLKIVGYAANSQGRVINTIYHHKEAIKFDIKKNRNFKTILSVGSSMDSGKTTTAAYLCRGLKTSGCQVAYIKLTGTVFNKDKMLAYDCGADVVSDFSELGFPSTYLCPTDTIMDIYEGLLSDVTIANPDYVVIEIADGLYQQETQALLNHPLFTETIDHVILSCCDSLAVNTGIQLLSPIFDTRLFALAGLFTGSPLLVSEVKDQCTIPILTLPKLIAQDLVRNLLSKNVNIAV